MKFHSKCLEGLDLINPKVNKFTIKMNFIERITLLLVNLTKVTNLPPRSKDFFDMNMFQT